MINIYFLDSDPKMSAFAHCDEHVKEMIPAYTQILCNAHHLLDPDSSIIKELNELKRDTSINETTWVTETKDNYQWLHDLWFWLQKEYWYRFDDMHDTWSRLYNKLSHIPNNISEDNFVSPEQWEIPEEFVENNLEDIFQNTIAGHRNYYTNYCKENDVKWSAPEGATRTAPSWIVEYANV